jgi:hypothetical protein
MNETEYDTDFLNTLIAAAKWHKIAGLVAGSGMQVLLDDYEMRQGRNDLEFMCSAFEHDVKSMLDIYDFVADQVRRKELRAIFRRILAFPAAQIEPVAKILWPLKQRVEEYDFLAKHGCEPPDGGYDA